MYSKMYNTTSIKVPKMHTLSIMKKCSIINKLSCFKNQICISINPGLDKFYSAQYATYTIWPNVCEPLTITLVCYLNNPLRFSLSLLFNIHSLFWEGFPMHFFVGDCGDFSHNVFDFMPKLDIGVEVRVLKLSSGHLFPLTLHRGTVMPEHVLIP